MTRCDAIQIGARAIAAALPAREVTGEDVVHAELVIDGLAAAGYHLVRDGQARLDGKVFALAGSVPHNSFSLVDPDD